MGSELTEWLVIVGGVMVAVLALRALSGRRGSGAKRKRLWKSRRSYRPWDQEAELLRLCHGDRQLVERLIAHELERSPKLSRAGAALAAATRLRHDKG